MEEITTLQRWVEESSRIVAFTGAGCSTESGLPEKVCLCASCKDCGKLLYRLPWVNQK